MKHRPPPTLFSPPLAVAGRYRAFVLAAPARESPVQATSQHHFPRASTRRAGGGHQPTSSAPSCAFPPAAALAHLEPAPPRAWTWSRRASLACCEGGWRLGGHGLVEAQVSAPPSMRLVAGGRDDRPGLTWVHGATRLSASVWSWSVSPRVGWSVGAAAAVPPTVS